jgi:hypothetical protein
MAHNGHTAGDQPESGHVDTDYAEHYKMWLNFWAAGKWGTVALIAIAGLLAIFRTHNG